MDGPSHVVFHREHLKQNLSLYIKCSKLVVIVSSQTIVENYQGGLVLTPAWPLEKRGDEKDPSSRSRPDLQSAGGKQTWRERELERWMTRRGKKPVLDFPAR